MEKNAPQGQGKDVKKGAKKWWLLCTFDNFFIEKNEIYMTILSKDSENFVKRFRFK